MIVPLLLRSLHPYPQIGSYRHFFAKDAKRMGKENMKLRNKKVIERQSEDQFYLIEPYLGQNYQKWCESISYLLFKTHDFLNKYEDLRLLTKRFS